MWTTPIILMASDTEGGMLSACRARRGTGDTLARQRIEEVVHLLVRTPQAGHDHLAYELERSGERLSRFAAADVT